MVAATYEVAVDLNGDGDFSDAGEVITSDVSTNPPGLIGAALFSCTRGRDQRRVLAPPMAGAGACTLNDTGSYGPTSNVKAGKQVRLRATYNPGSGAVTYDLHRGILDRPVHYPTTNFDKLVGLRTFGTISRLAGKKISTAVYSSITIDVAIGHLLDAAGWPAADRVLDMGKTTLSWWWLDEEDAMTALVTLLNTEGPGAAIYEDGQGRIVFKNRHARVTDSRSTTIQTTFRDTGSEPLIAAPFTYDPGLKDIVNVCTIEVQVRAAQTIQTIWTLGSTVTLAPNEVRSYVVRGGQTQDATTGQYIGPFTGAVAPTSGAGDFTVASGSLASVTLNRTSGASVTVTLTAGASGASVTGLRVRAQALAVTSTTTVTNTLDTSASQSEYGVQTYQLPVRPEIPVNTAQDFVNAVVGFYQDGRQVAEINVMANGDATRMVAALAREVGDRVRVIEGNIPIDAEFYVDHISHRILSPATHLTTFGLEEADTASYFTLDTSVLDGVDVLGF